MGNPDGVDAMLEQAGEQFDFRRLGKHALIGLGITLLCFKVHWVLGYAALLLLPPMEIAQLRPKYQRFAKSLYLVWVVALISSTVIQMRFEGLMMSGGPVARSLPVRILLGGPWGYRVAISIALGLVVAVVLLGLPFLGLLMVSSEYILALHQVLGVDRFTALKYLFSLVMGVNLPWQIVENGKATTTKPKGVLERIGGPGLVIIKPGNAAVFEWGGEVTRIWGPGLVKTRPYEKIRKVVDLRPLWNDHTAKDVLTSDRIPLSFELTFGYQVQPAGERPPKGPSIPQAEGRISGALPVERQSVYEAVFRLDPATPEDAVRATLDALLRDQVRGYTLDQMYDYSVVDGPQPRDNVISDIENAVRPQLEAAIRDWGLKLLGMDIRTIEMPEGVRKRVLEWWETAWARQSMVALAQGERLALKERGAGQAEALAAVEAEKGVIRRQLTQDLMKTVFAAGGKLPPPLAQKLLELLQTLSTRMTCDSVAALKYLDTVERLLQTEGPKTIIIGEAPSMLMKGDNPDKQ